MFTRSFLRRLSTELERRNAARVVENCDVVIVGAGPAGLGAAIRLKQLSQKHEKELRVIVLEKGGEVGAHILSGAVIEPKALNELIPDWQEKQVPVSVLFIGTLKNQGCK